MENYISSLNYECSDKDFIYSLLTFDPETNIAISDRVTGFFKQSLPALADKRFSTGSFLIKPGNIATELLLHQDWTYAESERPGPITCWAPLIDTGPESGGIFLIKGSQSFFKTYRSNSYATSRFGISDIGPEVVTFLEVKRGEILLFDPSVWHGSAMNTGAKPRVAVTCLMQTEPDNLFYFHKKDEQTCEVYEFPEYGLESYLRSLVHNEIPEALRLVKSISYHHYIPDKLDLAKASKQ